MKQQSLIHLAIGPQSELIQHKAACEHNTVVVLTDCIEKVIWHFNITPDMLVAHISELISLQHANLLFFLSGTDQFQFDILFESLQLNTIKVNDCTSHLTLLVKYLPPPVKNQRFDGKVESFIISKDLFDPKKLIAAGKNFDKLAYAVTYALLNDSKGSEINIRQIGKENDLVSNNQQLSELLNNSLLIIPHKGSAKLLNRCLFHLDNNDNTPSRINLCFDDPKSKKLQDSLSQEIRNRIKIFVNIPCNVGPYPARHYSIVDTAKEYIFFQDSDDISLKSRFGRQLSELKERGLDMIGSHELRVDQFKKILTIFRYPLICDKESGKLMFHSLFHPTSLIRRESYLKTGGFSTDRKFGYDSQFLLRSILFLKIGNVDDFLYIRFKRPNSLTTNAQTKIGSNLRTFLLWRWRVDFKLVLENKLILEDSSLIVNRHEFDYAMKHLPSDPPPAP